MSLIKVNDPLESTAKFLLASISEVTASLSCLVIEREKFIQFGCFIYRASPIIMELQATEDAPRKAAEILQSISQKVDIAKDLVSKCQTSQSIVSDPELKLIISQLEEVTSQIGEDLSMIPPSTFEGQKYAAVAFRSLSKEMRHVNFQITQEKVQAEQERGVENIQEQNEQARAGTDLYSSNVGTSLTNSMPLSASDSGEPFQSSGGSSMKPPSMNINTTENRFSHQFIEPMYRSFYCPLSKKIMDDPVTVQTGITYERKAIQDWLDKFEDSAPVFCPATGKKLTSRVLETNMALKTTIEEWKDRNELGRIKMARAALSLASSSSMILEAIKDLQEICERKVYSKVQVCNTGMLPLLVKLLAFKDRGVRTALLDLLRQLAEDDNDSKEMVAGIMDLSVLVRLLSSSHQPTRCAALLLLLELSKTQQIRESIGSISGAILVLITNKYNCTDSFASEKADEILMNLESHPNNVKLMAENGHVEPLLKHLTEGSNEMKQEMAMYLGEICLHHDNQTYVSERAVSSLVTMVQSDDDLTRTAGYKALARISTHHPNSKVMFEAGIIPLLTEEIFNHQISDGMNSSKAEAASILANIISSGLDLDLVKANAQGHTMVSDYIVYNIVHMLKSSAPKLNISLLKILLSMTKFEKSMATIVSVLKEGQGSYALIELINNPEEELSLEAIKLLQTLSSFMGHMISESICKTSGLPENLIRIIPSTINQVTEKDAISAKFLAELPHQNLTLNVAIINKGLVPDVLHKIEKAQQVGTRSSKYGNTYLEGLVGILVRLTTTLYDPQILTLAMDYNFTAVFTDLLTKTSSHEVRRLSANGLENLSVQSVNLSKPPQVKEPSFKKVFSMPKSLSFRSSRRRKMRVPICHVHRGTCSSKSTFCLIEAKAVEGLLSCLHNENAKVVEAALSALYTLLDDKVDVEMSLNLLNGVDLVQHVLNVVKDHREESVLQNSFSIIEKFLARDSRITNSPTSVISQDKMLHVALVSALHRGDEAMKQVAERILRHLNRMPHDSIPELTTATYTYTRF
ncbi:hypothetical protein SAY87_016975 [Trapa incisa]|uniref:RING-type E3 ubiquitin transferase n=1 Tax=Trapa incisa TaxID=236973 RepID=A0AAN7LB19_9MYRT|nr:hypothetical protein SAY87_016975 [Trapa incisa]